MFGSTFELRTRIALVATLIVGLGLSPAQAQAASQAPSFIRDAEVENTLRLLSTPIFQAAGLNPEAVSLNILLDPTLNAFVAGGQNMFFHTGLLLRVESPNQLIGVMAHETGHIAGGHISRMDNTISDTLPVAILGVLAGAAVGAATGRGDAAAAIALGSQDMAMRNILSISRMQESSADQAGIRFLEMTHQSPKGMLEFMETLGDQELLISVQQDPYVRTHPLTRDRISALREAVQHSPWSGQPDRPEYIEPFRRMRAKLFAYLEPPSRTIQRYKESDKSIEGRYARAIAAYRKPDLATALPLMDELIAERPKDPYFYEMKAQMLFENARGTEAIPFYQKAVELLPGNALIRVELAQDEIEQEDNSLLADAEANLNTALEKEPDNSGGWTQLGIAYGKEGLEGMASYAMAEAALLEGRPVDAAFLANKAQSMLDKGGPIWLRLQDIKERAEAARAKAKRRG